MTSRDYEQAGDVDPLASIIPESGLPDCRTQLQPTRSWELLSALHSLSGDTQTIATRDGGDGELAEMRDEGTHGNSHRIRTGAAQPSALLGDDDADAHSSCDGPRGASDGGAGVNPSCLSGGRGVLLAHGELGHLSTACTAVLVDAGRPSRQIPSGIGCSASRPRLSLRSNRCPARSRHPRREAPPTKRRRVPPIRAATPDCRVQPRFRGTSIGSRVYVV